MQTATHKFRHWTPIFPDLDQEGAFNSGKMCNFTAGKLFSFIALTNTNQGDFGIATRS